MAFKVAHGTAGGRVPDCHHMDRSHSVLNRPPYFCSRPRAVNKKAALWAAVAGLCLFRLRPAQPSAARTALCASSEWCSLVEPAGSPPHPAAPNKKATARVAVLFGGEGVPFFNVPYNPIGSDVIFQYVVYIEQLYQQCPKRYFNNQPVMAY